MSKIFKIIKREFLTKVFTKGFLIGTMLGPIFLLGIMFGPAYFMSVSTEEPMTFRLVDHSGFFIEKVYTTFDDTLKNGQKEYLFSPIEPSLYNKNPKKYQKDLQDGIIKGILIIPDDIFNNGKMTFISKSLGDISLIQKLQNGISEIVNSKRLQEAGFDPEKVKQLTKKVSVQTIKLVKGEEKERGFDQEYISSMIFLFMLYMTIIIYGSTMMRGVVEEKSSRVIEVLLSSTNSFHLMIGKLFGVGSVGLVQYIIWVSMGMITFFIATQTMPAMAEFINVSPIILLYFMLFFVIGFFTFSTLYMAVGAMCSDMQDAQSLSAPVTILIILPFIISFMVIKDPTTDIARILSFLPFFTPLIMFLRINLVSPPIWEIAVSVLINFITIVLIIWVSARIYRVGILMYGKRPTVPEIIRWVKYS
jgi:ABC-2 type transport system permease protein